MHCWREHKMGKLLWKTISEFVQQLSISLLFDSAIPLLDTYSREIKWSALPKIYSWMWVGKRKRGKMQGHWYWKVGTTPGLPHFPLFLLSSNSKLSGALCQYHGSQCGGNRKLLVLIPPILTTSQLWTSYGVLRWPLPAGRDEIGIKMGRKEELFECKWRVAWPRISLSWLRTGIRSSCSE